MYKWAEPFTENAAGDINQLRAALRNPRKTALPSSRKKFPNIELLILKKREKKCEEKNW